MFPITKKNGIKDSRVSWNFAIKQACHKKIMPEMLLKNQNCIKTSRRGGSPFKAVKAAPVSATPIDAATTPTPPHRSHPFPNLKGSFHSASNK